MLGLVGRQSGQLRLAVAHRHDRATLGPWVWHATLPGTWVYTDEWVGYDLLPQLGRPRAAVRHARPHPEYARDDDGDGIREVHCNTSEGIWTGLRNFLRPFRGVNKIYLDQYAAVFAWGYNHKTVTPDLIELLLHAPCTRFGS